MEINMGKKEQIVWQYILKNKLAKPREVAEATGVSYVYVNKLMKRIGTPSTVFKAEAKAKADNATAMFTDFDRAIANAPIRSTVNVWTDKIWQFALSLAIMVVVGAWLYMVW